MLVVFYRWYFDEGFRGREYGWIEGFVFIISGVLRYRLGGVNVIVIVWLIFVGGV
jgi:hypothetical protein